MKPVVILDTSVLHGRKPFTRAQSALLLNLARTGDIRLVVPEVVLHELSRQWAEDLHASSSKLRKALEEVNSTLADVDAVGISVEFQTMARSDFYDHAAAMLHGSNVEIAPCPKVAVRDLLERDLGARKPFTRDGKGFRDALIWETVSALCCELDDGATPVLFVTTNTQGFLR